MKLVILSFAGSIHTVRWANSLSQRGIEVHVVSQLAPSPEFAPEIRCHRLPYSGNLGYFRNALPLRRLLDDIRPNLLHVHYAGGYGTLGWLSGFHPRIVSVWGSDVFVTPYESWLKRYLITTSLKTADWVCSTSQVMAKQTLRLCPRLSKLSVTPFGVDLDRFRPDPYRKDPRHIVIGTVKSLKPEYGIDILIQGFAACLRKLRAQGFARSEDLRLRIVGGGDLLADLQRLCAREHIEQLVEFPGYVPHEEVPVELNKLDIYVAASRTESFGVAVIEASACEIPVVVSDVGGLPEVVKKDVTGLIVPPENPAALGDALARLVVDRDLRQKFGAAGRTLVEHDYDWSENVTRMLHVYRQLLGRSVVPTSTTNSRK